METIKGGFAFSDADELLINQQRAITAQINNNFIQVGATFLQMSGKNPFTSDWFKKKFKDTNLQEWIDNPDMRSLNLGFNLQFGWLDVDIDAQDPVYNRSIIAAFKFLSIDTRFAFGRISNGVPSHVMVQLNEASLLNFDEFKKFEPDEFKIDGKRFKAELRSMGPVPPDGQNVIKEARQTVVPGSIYSHKIKPGEYDISVWYTPDGKSATSVGEVAATTPRKVDFSQLLTGIAFGTFLYVMRPHWVEGGRQQFGAKVAGWLARVVRESHGVNEHDGTSKGTHCPISSPEMAEQMIDFLCTEMGDKEAFMRKRVFRDAVKKLENNPDAKIPGWPALEGEIGSEAMMALRVVFMPGVDVSPLMRMSEQYIYDEADDRYIDRKRFEMGANYTHDGSELDRRHRNDFLEVAGKSKPLFKVFESSPLRKRINGRDLYPSLPPGCIFRKARAGSIIPDDQEYEPGERRMFNTWGGWPIKPTRNPDPALLAKCEEMLDRLLGLLTQDNPKQAEWLKKWIAWIVQFPGQKQQVAPVLVGGQGIGKSFFGNIFLEQLFQDQWGSASPKVLEGAFSVEPFINKMLVFMDEAKFSNEASVDEIKKLIRSVRQGGAEKFMSSRTYSIYARVMFASNRFDMNIGQQNVQDRALFYIKTYDKDFLKKTDLEFKTWTVTLKPFFDEFNTFMDRMDVKEHYMYLFNTLPVSRHELEDTNASSSNDAHIVESNMSYARRVAKEIVEGGRIVEDLDISAPFTTAEFNQRVNETGDMMRIRFIQPKHVFNEFYNAGLLGQWTSNGITYWRFKFKMGTLLEEFGKAIGVELERRFTFAEDDFGENHSEFIGAKHYRGMHSRFGNI